MRKMMGGAVLYCDGTVFALVADDELYFKSDTVNEGAFEAEGLGKFEFTGKDGKIATMNYRHAPLDSYDDPDAMRQWALLGIEAGQRAPEENEKQEEKALAQRLYQLIQTGGPSVRSLEVRKTKAATPCELDGTIAVTVFDQQFDPAFAIDGCGYGVGEQRT